MTIHHHDVVFLGIYIAKLAINHGIYGDVRPFNWEEGDAPRVCVSSKGGTFGFCALSGALLRPESYPFGKGKYHHKAHISLLSWLPSGTYFVCDFSFFSFTLLDFVCFCHHLALLRLGRWPCLQNDFERCRWVAKKGENIQWDIVRPWWIWKMCDIYIYIAF
jgi:hypothetical protein